jgi:chemotaxis protein CheD
MSVHVLQAAEVELTAVNVVQGGWVIERQRVLRTVLGSCVAVCLYDAYAGVGGVNHYVFPPRGGRNPSPYSNTTFSGDICMEGLFEAVLQAGARKDNLRAKAFGGGTMFAEEERGLAVGARNASYAKYWLDQVGIPLDLSDFHGNCARKLLFHPASGQHLCRRLPVNFAPAVPPGGALKRA